jgi:hypothetical protein
VVLVGGTRARKITPQAPQAEHGLDFTLLPDRRDLTDRLIIAAMQAADGQPSASVSDREQRFAYTRRYREQHPGGMAHAIAQLWVDPVVAGGLLIFDGLRGANEVEHAAALLPRARFVMLDAPDWVRVQRLLNRQDAFDQVDMSQASATGGEDFAALGVPEATGLFTPAERQAMRAWVRSGAVTAAGLAAKLRIVVEERRSYDPAATAAALRACAPARTLYLDTVAYSPDAVAGQVAAWLAA